MIIRSSFDEDANELTQWIDSIHHNVYKKIEINDRITSFIIDYIST
jgi:hypothetical protein